MLLNKMEWKASSILFTTFSESSYVSFGLYSIDVFDTFDEMFFYIFDTLTNYMANYSQREKSNDWIFMWKSNVFKVVPKTCGFNLTILHVNFTLQKSCCNHMLWGEWRSRWNLLCGDFLEKLLYAIFIKILNVVLSFLLHFEVDRQALVCT